MRLCVHRAKGHTHIATPWRQPDSGGLSGSKPSSVAIRAPPAGENFHNTHSHTESVDTHSLLCTHTHAEATSRQPFSDCQSAGPLRSIACWTEQVLYPAKGT